MRIAMIGHKRIPSREGGIEIVVEELATRMIQTGHQVTVYNRAGKHVSREDESQPTKRQREYKGIRIVTVPTSERKSLNAVVYSFLSTLHAIFGKYDVIHFHAEGPCYMIWLPKLFGIKTVATIHGLDWKRAKWGGFATKFLLFGEKCAVRFARHIIVLTNSMANYFQKEYNRNTTVISNGIDIRRRISPQIITEKYRLHGNDYILFLARIVPEKGLHYLIDAYEDMNTNYKLVIAGGSSHTDEYMQQIQERVASNPNIIMTGFVEGDELVELYSNCSLYVLPSDIEGMPISLLEALSYGNRCIISDIPENIETAEGLAVSFEKGNVKDLKESVETVLQQEMDDEQRMQIIEKVKEKYDWDVVVRETLNLYQR